MTNLPPPSRPSSGRLPAPAADALLLRGLAAWREDVARPAADDLAVRVLAAARRGDADDLRFRRVARVYSAAAAVLLVVGVGGSVLAVRPPAGASSRAPRIDDLETSRLARELAITLDGQRVGDR